MRRKIPHAATFIAAGLTFALLAPAPVVAQHVAGDPTDAWCDRTYDHDRERYCEVREIRLDVRSSVEVDGGPNGGIRVEGWDRDEILVRARVQTRADSRADAESLARAIDVDTDGTIHARGPRRLDDDLGWSVSYRVFVPRRSDLRLETTNGGVSITGVRGRIVFRAVNGGVRLERLAGDVRGQTTNGSVSVRLDGDRWDGGGLDVRTTNGRVRLRIPRDYSARLVTGTVNGSLNVEFPIRVQGRIDRTIEATLGDGGPTIRAATTNGGVVVESG